MATALRQRKIRNQGPRSALSFIWLASDRKGRARLAFFMIEIFGLLVTWYGIGFWELQKHPIMAGSQMTAALTC